MVDQKQLKRLVEIEQQKSLLAGIGPTGILIAVGGVVAAAVAGFTPMGAGLLLLSGVGTAMAYYGDRQFKSLVQESLEISRSIIEPSQSSNQEPTISQSIEKPSTPMTVRIENSRANESPSR